MSAPHAAAFVALAETQRGDRYVYGAEVSPSDPDPLAHGKPLDCSELVEWDTARLGVPMPDGSGNQFRACQKAGLLIPIPQGILTLGALLFGGPQGSLHVAISRGDGTTIEARGVRYGVNNFPTAHRPWTAAGLVPGLLYDALPAAPIPSGARRMDERDRQTHDALGRTEALVGRLMRHAGLQPQPGPAVPPADGLQQAHDAAARIENDVAALVQKLGA